MAERFKELESLRRSRACQIEDLAPSNASDGPNPEYPWQGRYGISAPAEHLFASLEFDVRGMVNLLKGGILFSDALSTVSKGYAKEIQTPEHGFGLDDLLRDRAGSLTGIVNGVDYTEWSPEGDPYIAAHYTQPT